MAHPLNEAIKEFVKSNNIKQIELAGIWKLKPSSISKKLDSDTSPSVDDIMSLFAFFGQSIFELLVPIYPAYRKYFLERADKLERQEREIMELKEILLQMAITKKEHEKLVHMLSENLFKNK